MSSARPRIRHRGMTLVELLIALAITTVIGLAMVTVLTTVARGLSSANGERSALQRANVLSHRLTSYSQAALAIIAADKGGLAMWLHDETGEQQVNLLELRVFWFDEDSEVVTLEYVSFPDTWTEEEVDAANTIVTSIEDPFVVMEQQRALGYTVSNEIVDGVGGIAVIASNKSAPASPRFAMTLDLVIEPGRTEPVLLSVALPMHTEPE